MCDYWYDDDEDTLKDILTAIENITRIMATEGTLFIFEWQYTMYLSIHPTPDQHSEDTRQTMNLDVHEQLGITNKELDEWKKEHRNSMAAYEADHKKTVHFDGPGHDDDEENRTKERVDPMTNESVHRGVTFIQVQPMDTIEETSSIIEIEDETAGPKEIPSLSQSSELSEDHQMQHQLAENNPEEIKSEGSVGHVFLDLQLFL